MEMMSAVCGLGIVNITTACVGKTCFNIYTVHSPTDAHSLKI